MIMEQSHETGLDLEIRTFGLFGAGGGQWVVGRGGGLWLEG